mmetsp:Transcript_24190/g.69819  ORF Transcript_24190/g.69819 Transcript_24190/m.69819 type:complete len:215 (-) Transcript_24190:373-1017(-)
MPVQVLDVVQYQAEVRVRVEESLEGVPLHLRVRELRQVLVPRDAKPPAMMALADLEGRAIVALALLPRDHTAGVLAGQRAGDRGVGRSAEAGAAARLDREAGHGPCHPAAAIAALLAAPELLHHHRPLQLVVHEYPAPQGLVRYRVAEQVPLEEQLGHQAAVDPVPHALYGTDLVEALAELLAEPRFYHENVGDVLMQEGRQRKQHKKAEPKRH